MSIQDGKIGQIRNTLDGWPCLFCGSFKYYVVIRCRASEDDGDLIARCSQCDGARGIATGTESSRVKPRSPAHGQTQ